MEKFQREVISDMELSKKNKFIIVGLAISPIVIVIVLTKLIFGNIGELLTLIGDFRNNLTIEPTTFPTLSETINYTIASYAAIVTSIFSYVVWKTSVQSYKVAEAVKDLETNRDEEATRENALIIYYDLLSGLNNLLELYISRFIDKTTPNPNKLFFSEEWIKNVANLRDHLTADELDTIYQLYGEMYTLKSLLDQLQFNQNNGTIDFIEMLEQNQLKDAEIDEIKKRLKKVESKPLEELDLFIEKLIGKLFASFLPLPLLQKKLGRAEKLLNRKYYLILRKIHLATFTDNKVIREVDSHGVTSLRVVDILVYNGRVKDGIPHGRGKIYTNNGKIKYDGEFVDGMFVTGIARDYYEDGEPLYEIEYKNNMKVKGTIYRLSKNDEQPWFFNGDFDGNDIVNGFVTEYRRDNNKIFYEGEVVNREYSGDGTLYKKNGSVFQQGQWIKGEFVNGRQSGPNKFYFEGEFKHSNPWTGVVRNYSNDYVKNFKGNLIDGEPHQGTGYIFYRDQDGVDLHQRELEDQEQASDEDEYEDYNQNNEYELRHSESNKRIRETYERWEDFILTDWDNGLPMEREHTEQNIEVYFYKNSKKET